MIIYEGGGMAKTLIRHRQRGSRIILYLSALLIAVILFAAPPFCRSVKALRTVMYKVEVTIPMRIGEGGKLFGSVTGKDVSEALKKQNIDIDKKKISIKDTITGTGVYEAVIKVHPAITSTVKVNIVAE